MTKTKAQLRAEAVERLNGMALDTGSAVKKLAIALDADWNPDNTVASMGRLRARLIDLLTDDEQPEEADSRGKLEGEVWYLASGFTVSNPGYVALYDGIIALLDRQAAITQAECERICDTCELVADLQEDKRTRTGYKLAHIHCSVCGELHSGVICFREDGSHVIYREKQDVFCCHCGSRITNEVDERMWKAVAE